MKQNLIKMTGCILAVLAIGVILSACDDMDALHDTYIKDGERVYLAKPTDLVLRAGRERLVFDFKIINPNTETYCLVTDATGSEVFRIDISNNTDTVKVFKELSNLDEGSYTYRLQTFNPAGNTSLAVTAFGSVYGDFYQSTLQNVSVNSLAYDDDKLKIELGGVTGSQLGIELTYFSLNNASEKILTLADVKELEWDDDLNFYLNEVVSPDHALKWRTAYLPEQAAVDTFFTDWNEMQPPLANAFMGNYASTGTFTHPTSGARNFTSPKTLVAVDDQTCETDHSDLGTNGYKIRLKINADNSVTVTQFSSGTEIGEPVPDAINAFDPVTKTFSLNYRYSGSGGYRVVSETLVRN